MLRHVFAAQTDSARRAWTLVSSLSLAAVSLALAVKSPVALAADLPSRKAPEAMLSPTPVSSWDGFYVGSIFGGGQAQFKSSQTGSKSINPTGQTGGGLIGYNQHYGSYVYGLEGDITLDLIRGHNAGTAGLISHDADTLYTSRLRGRFGYDLGQFMPYVAGGVAFNETYVYNGLGNISQGQTKRQTGFTLGAGVDYKTALPLIGPVIVRAEYLYDAYPGQSYLAAGPANAPVRVKGSANYLRIALIDRIGETPRKPVTDVEMGDWAGAYGGIMGGAFSARPRTSFNGASATTTATGPLGGIYMGKNFQYGRVVLGIDSATALTDAKSTTNLPAGAAGSLSYRNYVQADLRGRVGYAYGQYLPFFAGGFSFGRSEQRNPITGSERGRIPTEAWTLGAGVDYMINDRYSLRGEYLYEKDLRAHDVTLDGNTYSTRRDGQTVRLGLAYHFH